MLNVELSESAATGCARAPDEFRTFIIQNSTLTIMVAGALRARAADRRLQQKPS
jgi:hypothetical protein